MIEDFLHQLPVKMNFEKNSFYENAVAALCWNICMVMWIYLFLARDLCGFICFWRAT